MHTPVNLFKIVKHLYLPSIRRKKAPTSFDNRVFNILKAKGLTLGTVDAKRFFTTSVKAASRCFKFDPAKSQSAFNLISGVSASFSWPGVSFTISKRILDYARKSLPATDDKISPYFFKMTEILHNFLTGNWHEEFGENLIDYDIKIGEIMCASFHLIFLGFIYMELGDFDHTKNIIKKLKRIDNEFNDDGAKSYFLSLKWASFKKTKKIRRCIESYQ